MFDWNATFYKNRISRHASSTNKEQLAAVLTEQDEFMYVSGILSVTYIIVKIGSELSEYCGIPVKEHRFRSQTYYPKCWLLWSCKTCNNLNIIRKKAPHCPKNAYNSHVSIKGIEGISEALCHFQNVQTLISTDHSKRNSIRQWHLNRINTESEYLTYIWREKACFTRNSYSNTCISTKERHRVAPGMQYQGAFVEIISDYTGDDIFFKVLHAICICCCLFGCLPG